MFLIDTVSLSLHGIQSNPFSKSSRGVPYAKDISVSWDIHSRIPVNALSMRFHRSARGIPSNFFIKIPKIPSESQRCALAYLERAGHDNFYPRWEH